MKKMIVCDLDGTLLNNDNEIPKNTIEFLNNLINKNFIIVLASGRPYRGMLKYANHFPSNTPLISENGAYIGSIDNSIKTDLKSINPKKFISLFKDNKEIIKSANFSTVDKVFIYNRLAKLEPLYHIDSNTIVIEGAFDEIENFEAPNGALFIIESSRRGEFENYIITRCPSDINYRLMGYDTKNAIYEITSGVADKANAIKKLLKIYNIDTSNLIVFGDGENDVNMINLAGVSVAMKNGCSLIREQASYITSYDNNNEGVYHFLKEYIH